VHEKVGSAGDVSRTLAEVALQLQSLLDRSRAKVLSQISHVDV
jgi:hypothetical protein